MQKILFGLLLVSAAFAAKSIYVPTFITDDLNNSSSQWSYSRSVETDNWIIFWESGFGSDPSSATGSYYVNMDTLEAVVEKSFTVNVDSLKMVIKDSSLTDKYKQMFFLVYTTDWTSYGSGQDDSVGSVFMNPDAVSYNAIVAHEIGHGFQYMTGADVSGGGYRWGFESNGDGSNGFWEQCAQWQAWRVYPDQEFSNAYFTDYIAGAYKHMLHEDQRYANYFLPEYWSYKRGIEFIGKLWRESVSPEDPVDTYMRMTSVTQSEFNDEMYDQAARLTTWDLPAIKSYGADYIDSRSQVSMTLTSDSFWRVDSSEAIENYGYNCIQLTAPSTETDVSVIIQGEAGVSGYRSLNIDQGGWRFGFVALLNDNSRVYSEMDSMNYSEGSNPEASLSFTVPANCSKLWLVVSGAPQEHWHHVWDDDNTNDEQWPYQVKFANTNLKGNSNLSLTTYTLTTSVVGSGSVTPAAGSGTYISGAVKTITATPDSGAEFTGWSGDASGTDNPLSLSIDQDMSVVANFTSTTQIKVKAKDAFVADARIDVYDLKGRRVSSIAGKNLSLTSIDNLGFHQTGIYQFVLLQSGRVMGVKMISNP
ncbi:MAG TPA: DUF6055 domain-containing protein [Fibrobacteraceae bacterium]|nr:DUF6055 domain-containing protein [Fibrobacteraceae bacterium]